VPLDVMMAVVVVVAVVVLLKMSINEVKQKYF